MRSAQPCGTRSTVPFSVPPPTLAPMPLCSSAPAPTFIAGADIKVFDTLKTAADSMARSERTHALLKRIEDCPKPVVAAIHGNALGGGNEVAMACHYRIATADAKVGQPEVLLGIIPGAAGTQRLPRLIGPALALRMCTDGKPVTASDAHTAGLVDRVVSGNLRDEAIAFARERAAAKETRKTRELDEKIADTAAGLAACRETRMSLAKTAKGMRAPYAAVEAIEAGLQQPFDAGSSRERELFAECLVSTESKALRHLFFAERDVAKIPDVPKTRRRATISRAAIVGSGTMGGGIAMTYANAGIPVSAQGRRSDRARSRHGDDSQELRVHRREGQAVARGF